MATRKKTLKEDRKSTALRHELFCREFIVDFNATRAAKESGFSKKTAGQTGSRLLKNVKIQTRIAELIKERKERVEFTAENVLAELGKLTFTNIKDIHKHSDERWIYFKNLDEIPRDIAAAIESIKQTDKGIEVKLYSKTKSIELALKHFGLLTENLNLSGEVQHKFDISMKKLRNAVNAIRGQRNNRKS